MTLKTNQLRIFPDQYESLLNTYDSQFWSEPREYTPTFESAFGGGTWNPGTNGIIKGWFAVLQDFCFAWAELVFDFVGTGISTPGTSLQPLRVTLPLNATNHQAATTPGFGSILGTAATRDNSSFLDSSTGVVQLVSATEVSIIGNAGLSERFWSSTVPQIWAAGDAIRLSMKYRCVP